MSVAHRKKKHEDMNKPTLKNILRCYMYNDDDLKSLLFADIVTFALFVWFFRCLLHLLDIWPIVR